MMAYSNSMVWKHKRQITVISWISIALLALHRSRAKKPSNKNCSDGSVGNRILFLSEGWKSHVKLAESIKWQMSSVQNPGWLFYIEDYTTQLYRYYNKPLQGSLLTNQYNGMS